MGNLNLISKKTGNITAYDATTVFHSAIGNDDRAMTRGAVMLGIGDSLSGTPDQTNKTFTIGAGMGILYGRQFSIPAAIVISLSALTGLKYCLVYAEVNTKNVTAETAKLKLAYDGGGYPTLDNQDLSDLVLGIATMPLWRFKYTALAPLPFSDVTCLFYGKKPGEAYKTLSLKANSKIFGNIVSTAIDGQTGYWTKTRVADETKASSGFEGHTIGSNLAVDSDGSYALMAANKVAIASDQHTTNDGVSGSCWWDGDDVRYKLLDKTPSNSQASLFGWLVYIHLSTAKWNAGFLGLGSSWVYNVVDWRTSLFFKGGGQISIREADTGGGMLVLSPYFVASGTIPLLKIILPSQLYHKANMIEYYPEAEIMVGTNFGRRIYGGITLCPILLAK
jgi:hypothetical protein